MKSSHRKIESWSPHRSFSLFFASFFFACLWGGSLAHASVPSAQQIIPLTQYGQIKVGAELRNCPKLAEELRPLRKKRAPRFYAYLFTPELPSKCKNLACGAFAQQILARGGFLIGGTDPDFLREVGLGSRSAEAAKSLLVLTDSHHQVTAIYRHVSTWDLRDALSAFSE